MIIRSILFLPVFINIQCNYCDVVYICTVMRLNIVTNLMAHRTIRSPCYFQRSHYYFLPFSYIVNTLMKHSDFLSLAQLVNEAHPQLQLPGVVHITLRLEIDAFVCTLRCIAIAIAVRRGL